MEGEEEPEIITQDPPPPKVEKPKRPRGRPRKQDSICFSNRKRSLDIQPIIQEPKKDPREQILCQEY